MAHRQDPDPPWRQIIVGAQMLFGAFGTLVLMALISACPRSSR